MSELHAFSMSVIYAQDLGPLSSKLTSELVSLTEKIFGPGDRLDGTWRIQNMPDLSSFTARNGDDLIGFKLGYAVTSQRYYSWLGGVHPSYRRAGIAGELMRRQHEWISSRGYKVIETEVVQTNHEMSRLNEESGFSVAGVRFDAEHPRVIYRKRIGQDHDGA